MTACFTTRHPGTAAWARQVSLGCRLLGNPTPPQPPGMPWVDDGAANPSYAAFPIQPLTD
jgi:hypothetical protein